MPYSLADGTQCLQGELEIGDWGAALLPFRGREKPCSLEEASLLEPLEHLEP